MDVAASRATVVAVVPTAKASAKVSVRTGKAKAVTGTTGRVRAATLRAAMGIATATGLSNPTAGQISSPSP